MMRKNRDIHDRVYRWVIDVLALVKKIPKNVQNNIVIFQITKSVISTGANDQEADAASGKKDFVYKYELTKREAKETCYWLSIIRDTISPLREDAQKFINEGIELINIFSSIIKNSMRNP